jgi:hypothetical protein
MGSSESVFTLTKCMRAFDNVRGEKCEGCVAVPDTLYQFWMLVPGEPQLTERVVRALPAFCGHACWRTFVEGRQFSDRACGLHSDRPDLH